MSNIQHRKTEHSETFCILLHEAEKHSLLCMSQNLLSGLVLPDKKEFALPVVSLGSPTGA